jgi:MFS family permease
VIIAMAMVSLGPLLDPMMKDLGIPLRNGGLISAALYLGNVSGILILNMLMARVPAKRVLTAGIFLQGVGLVLAGAAAQNLWSLCLAYVVVGFGGALLNTTCWMWLSTHVRENVAAAAWTTARFGVGYSSPKDASLCCWASPICACRYSIFPAGRTSASATSSRWSLPTEGCCLP